MTSTPPPSTPTRSSSPGDDDDEPVPRLPRSAGFKLSSAVVFRIGMTAALLVMIIVAQRPCADAVSGFVTNFDSTPTGSGSGSASDLMPRPGTVDVPSGPGSASDYVQLRPDMTEAEIEAAIEQARAKARAHAAPDPAPTPHDAAPD